MKSIVHIVNSLKLALASLYRLKIAKHKYSFDIRYLTNFYIFSKYLGDKLIHGLYLFYYKSADNVEK